MVLAARPAPMERVRRVVTAHTKPPATARQVAPQHGLREEARPHELRDGRQHDGQRHARLHEVATGQRAQVELLRPGDVHEVVVLEAVERRQPHEGRDDARTNGRNSKPRHRHILRHFRLPDAERLDRARFRWSNF